ncbi:hypothetical protein [Candidatus Nitrosocosmicus sp. R]
MAKLKRKWTTGISLDKEIWNKIDESRGDVSRSKYVLRIIEKSLPSKVSNFSQSEGRSISRSKAMNNHDSDNKDTDSLAFKDKACIAHCNKEGIELLNIIYINRVGRFCRVHAEELLALGLVTPLENSTENEVKSNGI